MADSPMRRIAMISIHAPAKGATACCAVVPNTDAIFQSTLPRRERRLSRLSPYLSKSFQSTLPRRERRGQKGLTMVRITISIHAPAKGATRCCYMPSSKAQQFQSTLPRRERLLMIRYAYRKRYFNPRSREGSDRNVQFTSNKTGNFNPRSREGSDQAQRRRREPAPFQSTLPRRERRFRCRRVHPVPRYFNPRSREGSDLRDLARKRRSNEFQSTLPRRERPPGRGVPASTRYFNPRSREGSDPPLKTGL